MTKEKPSPLEQVLGLVAPSDEGPKADVQLVEAAFLSLHDQDKDRARPPDDMFDRILSKIDQADTAPGTSSIPMSEGVWENIAPGIERKIVYMDRSAGVQSYFVRMKAGAILPEHDHDADEQCVVLQGQLEIGNSIYDAGTYHLARKGVPHVPITAHSDAIFFIHGAA